MKVYDSTFLDVFEAIYLGSRAEREAKKRRAGNQLITAASLKHIKHTIMLYTERLSSFFKCVLHKNTSNIFDCLCAPKNGNAKESDAVKQILRSMQRLSKYRSKTMNTQRCWIAAVLLFLQSIRKLCTDSSIPNVCPKTTELLTRNKDVCSFFASELLVILVKRLSAIRKCLSAKITEVEGQNKMPNSCSDKYVSIRSIENACQQHADIVKLLIKLRARLKEKNSHGKFIACRMTVEDSKRIASFMKDDIQLRKTKERNDSKTKTFLISVNKIQTTAVRLALLSFLSYLPPKRADLGNVIICNKDEDEKYKHNNRLVLKTRLKSYIALPVHKTSSAYTDFKEIIPAAAYDCIIASIKLYPRLYLIVDTCGKPYVKNNSFSQFHKRTFQNIFGKAMGVTMMRHVYISERVEQVRLPHHQRQLVAKSMLHSQNMQSKYIWRNIPTDTNQNEKKLNDL